MDKITKPKAFKDIPETITQVPEIKPEDVRENNYTVPFEDTPLGQLKKEQK
jgi:hypothetical protein